MTIPYRRTLSHLRDELKVRLGFNAQIANTAQSQIMTSFLRGAQAFIYEQYQVPEVRLIGDNADTSITTSQGTTSYDWPEQVNHRKLISDQHGGEGIYAQLDGVHWIPLRQGISWPHDSVSGSSTQSYPSRFDVGEKLELWPIPNGSYPIKIEAYKRLGYFKADDTAWSATTAKSLGDFIVPRTPPTWPDDLADDDHFRYECTQAGTTGGTAPTFPTEDGDTVADGSVVWTARLNTATIDDELIFQYALARGKAHYRHQDAEMTMQAVNTLLSKFSAQAHGKKRYISNRGGRAGRIRRFQWIY